MNLTEARRTFKDVRAVHVGSLAKDGAPHVVPLWFVWLEDALVVSCQARSQVWTNLRRDPRVAMQFDRGRAWTEQVGALVSGMARFVSTSDQMGRRALSAWFEKYREELSGRGFAAYTEQIHDPALFRIEVHRVATWMHAR